MARAVRALFGRGRDRAALRETPGTQADALQPVLDAVDDPLLVVAGTQVVLANAAARGLLGDYVAEEDVRLALRHPAAAALLAGREAGPVALAGLGGGERYWLLTSTDIDGQRRLLRLSDHSAQRAAERMRVDFVANASHELRTPLATLIGFIETLEEANGPTDAATRIRFLKIMGGEARRMQRLIDDLMSLSRIEADRYLAPRDMVDVARLARQVAHELGTAQPDARLAVRIADGPATIAGDAGQLSQLVHNIVGNALKYGGNSSVTITLDHEGDWLRLAVADEGEGIAPEHLPRLTERFYRVDAGRSRAGGGTGLGLAIVKHIVERHRGRMGVSSTLGRGTTVTIWLPAAPAPMS